MDLKTNHRILGIDPGSRVAGFAVLEALRDKPFHAKDFRYLDIGVINLPSSLPLGKRLGLLHDSLYRIGEMWSPEHCVIEKAFVGVNINSALRLGESRGAITCAVQRLSVTTSEISATRVKQLITGRGRASKEEVRKGLSYLFKTDFHHLPYDATDALAIALAFGLGQGSQSSNKGHIRLDALARSIT